jgi:hypothetical protein
MVGLITSIPQIQGYMELFDVPYCDLMSYTAKGSIIFRIYRDKEYWELLVQVLEDFYKCLKFNTIPSKSHSLTDEIKERSKILLDN